MKKHLLIVAMGLIAIGASAQTTTNIKSAQVVNIGSTVTDTAKKVYQEDAAKIYHITLDLNNDQLYALTATSEGTVDRSPQLTGQQIGQIKDEAAFIRKLITLQVLDQRKQAYEQWKADTAKVVQPVVLKPKK